MGDAGRRGIWRSRIAAVGVAALFSALAIGGPAAASAAAASGKARHHVHHARKHHKQPRHKAKAKKRQGGGGQGGGASGGGQGTGHGGGQAGSHRGGGVGVGSGPGATSVSNPGGGPFPASNPAAPLGASCPNADATPTNDNLPQIADAFLCLINQERAQQGLGALTVNAQLQSAAQHHSDDMIANNYFAHTSPSGETSDQRVFNSGYTAPGQHYAIGENLAWGSYDPSSSDPADNGATPQAIVNQWMLSPPHRANILDADFRETGFGLDAQVPPAFAGDPPQPGVTVTEEFGARRA